MTITELPAAMRSTLPTNQPLPGQTSVDHQRPDAQPARVGGTNSDSPPPAEEASIPIVVIDGEDHFDLIDPSSDSWSAAVAAIDAFVS